MSSRPRRSAAQRANEAITDMVEASERTSGMSSRTRNRASGASVTRDPPSSPGDSSSRHLNLNIKVPANKLRQATTAATTRTGRSIAVNSRDPFVGGEIIAGKRNRGAKKSYVVESSEDDDEEEEEDEEEDAEGEEEDDDDMEDLGDEDADGDEDDEEMEVDAEGDEEDAEGDDDDVDMDGPPAPATRLSRPSKSTASKPAAALLDDDDEEEELSDVDVSDLGDQDLTMGGGDDDAEGEEEDAEGEEEDAEGEEEDAEGEEEDAEGEEEEIEVVEEEDEEPEGADSDGETPADGSRAGTPDVTKMTKRQRARFEEAPQEYMKLSDEVQVKKVFTAEELSMRRAEMARRRRNLSEKRTEEVKMETINKLLKKQPPKTNRRAQLGNETPDEDRNRPSPRFVRWVSDKNGSRVSVPEEMLVGPAGSVFRPGGLGSGKMVEEVS